MGLDPAQIIEIRQLIRRLAKDHTVILSSHILAEIREVCSHILIISEGKLVASDTPENLERTMSGTGHVEIEAREEKHKVEEILSRMDEIRSVDCEVLEDGTVKARIEAKGAEDIREQLFLTFAGEGIPLRTLRLEKRTLEEIFLKLTQN